MDDNKRYEQGMKIRRAVLGDEHVDRALAATTDFNREFQAFNNGVTRDQIREVLLQSAIYCGVPAANSAFHAAGEVFQEMERKKEMDSKTEITSKKRRRS